MGAGGRGSGRRQVRKEGQRETLVEARCVGEIPEKETAGEGGWWWGEHERGIKTMGKQLRRRAGEGETSIEGKRKDVLQQRRDGLGAIIRGQARRARQGTLANLKQRESNDKHTRGGGGVGGRGRAQVRDAQRGR